MVRRCPSFASVIACVALFVALGGSSFAAPARDAAKQLISGKSIQNNSVGSADIKNGSLLRKDFKAGQLPAGARGPQGIAGATGPQGVPGRAGGTNVVVRQHLFGPLNTMTQVFGSSTCNPGERAVGGGIGYTDGTVDSADRVYASAPLGPAGGVTQEGQLSSGWAAGMTATAPANRSVGIYALCAGP